MTRSIGIHDDAVSCLSCNTHIGYVFPSTKDRADEAFKLLDKHTCPAANKEVTDSGKQPRNDDTTAVRAI